MKLPQWLYPGKLVCQPQSWKYQSKECIYHGSVEGVRFDGVWQESIQQYYNVVTVFAFNDLMQRYDSHVQDLISGVLQQLRFEMDQLRAEVQDLSQGQVPDLSRISSNEQRAAANDSREFDAPFAPRGSFSDARFREEVEASLEALSEQLEAIRGGADEALGEHGMRIAQLEQTVQQRIPERLAEQERYIGQAIERQFGTWKERLGSAFSLGGARTPGGTQFMSSGGARTPGGTQRLGAAMGPPVGGQSNGRGGAFDPGGRGGVPGGPAGGRHVNRQSV